MKFFSLEAGKTILKRIFGVDVGYDNTTSGLTADNLQAAIDEVVANGGGGGGDVTTAQLEASQAIQDAKVETNVTQTAHGFTIPTSGFLPVYYNNDLGIYELASSNSDLTAADIFIVALPDANTITLRESGILNRPAHGLPVGEWHYIGNTPGTVQSADGFTSDRIQYAVFPIDVDNIALRLEPMNDNSVIPAQLELVGIPNQSGINPEVQGTANTNRVMVVAINHEDGQGTDVTAVTYGGVPMTLIEVANLDTGFQNFSALYFMIDADIQNAVGNNLVLTYSAGAPDQNQQIYTNFYAGADQVAPVSDSSSNTATSATTITSPVNETENGVTLVASSAGVGGTFTITTPYENIQQINAGGAAHLFASRIAAANGVENTTITFSATANRFTIAVAHIRSA